MAEFRRHFQTSPIDLVHAALLMRALQNEGLSACRIRQSQQRVNIDGISKKIWQVAEAATLAMSNPEVVYGNL